MRIKFSPYSLNTYLDCSQKYYFAYEDAYVKQHKQEFKVSSPHLTVGDIVHLVLARYYNYDPSQRGWPLLGRLLQAQWSKPLGPSAGFKDRDDERDYFMQAQQLLKNFLTMQQSLQSPAYLGDPANREELLQTVLEPNLVLNGRVDRIDQESDGLHVIDYKTGKEKHDELQLLVYTLLAEAKFEQPVKRVSYFYLKTSTIETIEPDETLRREVKGRIVRTVSSIRQQVFLPSPKSRCQWCEYLNICPAKEQIQELLEAGESPTHQDFFNPDMSPYPV